MTNENIISNNIDLTMLCNVKFYTEIIITLGTFKTKQFLSRVYFIC